MNLNIDAARVVDLLLAHENDLVKEATKAVYWQVVAEAAMSDNGDRKEAGDDPVASDSDEEVVPS